MDKRYQVFVSSTYTDLIEERQKVFQTLMEMDCIPAGMELFPAADEDQFEFIKKIIDDCDYYVLIIGGRYGSLAEDQISYTEKEFDYAVSKGLKVVALIHGKPEDISSGKSEKSSELRDKLEKFKSKAKTGRMVKFWSKASDLPGALSLSLNKTIKLYPATGWVRADEVASHALLKEINELRKRNQSLEKKLALLKSENLLTLSDLVDFDSTHVIEVKCEIGIPDKSASKHWATVYCKQENRVDLVEFSWRDAFLSLADDFLLEKNEVYFRRNLETHLAKKIKLPEKFEIISSSISLQDYNQVRDQFMAYGLIDSIAFKGDRSHYLKLILTDKGKRVVLESRAFLKKQKPKI